MMQRHIYFGNSIYIYISALTAYRKNVEKFDLKPLANEPDLLANSFGFEGIITCFHIRVVSIVNKILV